MKNPFRTRFAVVRDKILPDNLEIEDSWYWYVVYRKWWQSHWRYAQIVYSGFSDIHIPKVYKSRDDAIASIRATILN